MYKLLLSATLYIRTKRSMNPWHMQTTVQVYMQEHPNIYVNLYRWKFWRPAEHSRTVDKLNDGVYLLCLPVGHRVWFAETVEESCACLPRVQDCRPCLAMKSRTEDILGCRHISQPNFSSPPPLHRNQIRCPHCRPHLSPSLRR